MTGWVRLGGAGFALVLTGVTAAGSLPPAGRADRAPEPAVVVATGSPLGVYHEYGRELCALIGQRLGPARVAETDGSVENLRMIAAGTATFAFTTADAALDAYLGHEPFARPVPMRAVARLYDNYLHLVVPAGSPVKSLAQLHGLRVGVGPDGSGAALVAGRVLAEAGLDQRNDLVSLPLSIDEAVVAIAARRVDAFFWSGGLPTAGIATLAARLPIRLIDLGDVATRVHDRYGSAYRVGRIPTGTYAGVAGAVNTVATPNYLVTSAAAAQRLVNDVTRLLFAGAPSFSDRLPPAGRLNRDTAIFTTPIPLHPGALAYYQSVSGQRDRVRPGGPPRSEGIRRSCRTSSYTSTAAGPCR